MKVRVYDIEWDVTDDGNIDFTAEEAQEIRDRLPEATIISIDADEDDDIDEMVLDELSDKFGYCVESCRWERV